jgi:predicted metal-dependent enzyme (double-stranded beta helix superfamily)
VLNVDAMVEDLRGALRETTAVLAVRDVLKPIVADGASVVAALGEPAHGGINVIHRSDELTVLNVIWPPLVSLYPHDHKVWACIGVYGGREDNAYHRRRPGGRGLDAAGGTTLETGDVLMLGDDVIHSVANPDRRYTGAIHVYGGDFFTRPRSEWDVAGPDAIESPRNLERTAEVFRAAEEAWARSQADSA